MSGRVVGPYLFLIQGSQSGRKPTGVCVCVSVGEEEVRCARP